MKYIYEAIDEIVDEKIICLFRKFMLNPTKKAAQMIADKIVKNEKFECDILDKDLFKKYIDCAYDRMSENEKNTFLDYFYKWVNQNHKEYVINKDIKLKVAWILMKHIISYIENIMDNRKLNKGIDNG